MTLEVKIKPSIIDEYNNWEDKKNTEIEIIYKQPIDNTSKNKILSYLKHINDKEFPTHTYILDISNEVVSKTHRLRYETENSEVLNLHCKNEININNTIYDNSDYKLQNKTKIPRIRQSEEEEKVYLNKLNCYINTKKEIIETNPDIKDAFINNYDKFRKLYRFKKLYSVVKVEDKYRIDFSVIKTGKGRSLINCMNNWSEETYELEIEYLPDKEKEDNDRFTEENLKNMLQHISKMYRLINDSYYLLHKKEAININKQYINLIKQCAHIKKIYNNSQYTHKYTIGPKVITLTKQTIHNMLDVLQEGVDLDTIDINDCYKITPKADGERYFMFITNNLEIYLINNNNNILNTGIILSKDNIQWANSLLDGEYIKTNTSNNIEYIYRYFDIYILNKKDYYNKHFSNRQEKMDELNDILKSFTKKEKYVKCRYKIYKNISNIVELNTTNFTEEDGEENSTEYKIDGVIFMPTNKLNNIFDIPNKQILKYKSIEENTIDVLVKDGKLKCGYNLYGKYVAVDLMSIKPYILDLYKRPIYDKEGREINIKLLNNKIIEIVYDSEKKYFIFNKIRYDKTIQYNNTKSIAYANNFNIINDIITNIYNPLTTEFLKTMNMVQIQEIKNYLNKGQTYYKIVDSPIERTNIQKIHNIIKAELISNSIKILENTQEQLKVLDIACGRGGDVKKFIDSSFINKYHKTSNIRQTGGVKFLLGIDYDSNNIEFYNMKKNNNARARFIEYKNSYENNNPNEELPYIYENNSFYYITGDFNKLDQNTHETNILNMYKQLLNVDPFYIDNDSVIEKQYGFTDRNNQDLQLITDIQQKYINNGLFNLFEKEQFELINCQMAIHYFNNKLDEFCLFVSNNLKPGGLFICTFMEQELVKDLLKKGRSMPSILDNSKEYNAVSPSILDKTDNNPHNDWWYIEHITDTNDINVKFGENDPMVEPLFSTQTLKDTFQKYNIMPYDTGSWSSNDELVEPELLFLNHKDLLNKNDTIYEFSKLYKYMIFIKPAQAIDEAAGLENLLK